MCGLVMWTPHLLAEKLSDIEVNLLLAFSNAPWLEIHAKQYFSHLIVEVQEHFSSNFDRNSILFLNFFFKGWGQFFLYFSQNIDFLLLSKGSFGATQRQSLQTRAATASLRLSIQRASVGTLAEGSPEARATSRAKPLILEDIIQSQMKRLSIDNETKRWGRTFQHSTKLQRRPSGAGYFRGPPERGGTLGGLRTISTHEELLFKREKDLIRIIS